MVSPVLQMMRIDLARKGRIAEVAAATGVTRKTLLNLRYGVTRHIRSDNYERLLAYYTRMAA
jgi:DNA-binding Xre family transcriptional regulator